MDSTTSTINPVVNQRVKVWPWILFILFLVILGVLFIYFLYRQRLGPPAVNYGQWLIQPAACVNGRQAVDHICTDPINGCLLDGQVRVQPYQTIAACQPRTASAEWQITQTPTETTWLCVATGLSGPNLCTIAVPGQTENWTSVELVPQPIGTKRVVNSTSLGTPSLPGSTSDNQIIWSDSCQIWPSIDGPRPLQEGVLGTAPVGLNYASLRQGTIDFQQFKEWGVQLCRLRRNRELRQTNEHWSAWLKDPIWLARRRGQTTEIWKRGTWLDYRIGLDYQDALVQFFDIDSVHAPCLADKLNVLVLDLQTSSWVAPDGRVWMMNTSYPLIRKWVDSGDIIRSKGQWHLSKESKIKYQLWSGAKLATQAYQKVLVNSQLYYLLLPA